MLPKPEITELLMTAYMSAEQERTLQFKPDRLETYVPLVAQGFGTTAELTSVQCVFQLQCFGKQDIVFQMNVLM